MVFTIESEQEEDGRWIAEVVEIPGAMTYGASQDDASKRAQALVMRIIADRLEHGEAGLLLNVTFIAA
jgi:predicted RNase H-like HicB family nuclease